MDERRGILKISWKCEALKIIMCNKKGKPPPQKGLWRGKHHFLPYANF